MSTKYVYLVRHAESLWNERKNKQNNPLLINSDLSKRGERQLEELKIRPELKQIRVIYCSPLVRSIRTALAFQRLIPDASLCVVPELREVRRDVSDIGSKACILDELRDSKYTCSPAVEEGQLCAAHCAEQEGDKKWWMDPKCNCKELHECRRCVRSRISMIKVLIAETQLPMLIVSHSDFLESLCGWRDAEHAKVARAVFTARPPAPSTATTSSRS